ncbi:MAG: mechanosensitive ion channel family protein [Coraliomargarita sp.]
MPKNIALIWFSFVTLLIVLQQPLMSQETEESDDLRVRSMEEEDSPFDVRDKLRRTTPRSTYSNFMRNARAGRYDVAAEYLDIYGLSAEDREEYTPEELARALKVILDHLFARMPEISNSAGGSLDDGVPPSLEWLADVRVLDEYAEILMRRVSLGDGTQVWLFSADTLEWLPELYEVYGYSAWEQELVNFFGGKRFLGVGLWLWLLGTVLTLVCFGLSWCLVALLFRLIRIKDERYNKAIRKLLYGPALITLTFQLQNYCILKLTLDAAFRELVELGPLRVWAQAWLVSRLFQFVFIYMERRYRSQGREVAAVLLRPLLTVVRVAWYMSVAFYLLHRAGVNISAMVAGLGIGGMAIALASQDTLKNLFGSMMILADKPFIVGQRVVVNGFDGVVEEIGVRSTKLRLLNGHQTSIPNDIISRVEVENIGSRPFIRCLMKVTVPFDTPPDKLEEAVQIAEKLLEDHEGMRPDFPPRVYLSEVAKGGFQLLIIFWYHPADYWMYKAYCQKFNLSLARGFEDAGIRFALPAQDLYMREAEGKKATS